jgi:protein ImuB
MNRRIACALIPDFPLVALLRDQPKLTGKPVALAENPTNRSTVLNANSLAAKEGIEAGMTIVQAMNVCPELTVLVRDEKKESFRFEQLLKSLRNFSPHVEQVKPQAVYLDVSGFRTKYPQEGNLAEQLIFFVKMQNYPVRVGIADNKFTSLAAAWVSLIDSYTIVPAGKERKFLESQPIQLLPINQEQYERLYRLGIRTMKQFAVLPDQEVAERFGSEGIRLLRLARGEDDSLLKPTESEEKEKQTRELESPLGTQIGILFYVNSILEEKFPQLAEKSLACEKILVTLSTARNNQIPIQISVAEGTNNPKTFIDILRLELEKIILPAPVSEINLSIQATSPLSSEQLSLYQKKRANPLRSILTKLRRVMGNGNVLSSQLVSAHRPEGRFHLAPVVSRRKEKKNSQVMSDSSAGFTRNSISGFRLYHPPKPTTVRTENGSIRFLIVGSWFGDVISQTGPWELSGEWWSHGYDRSYFEIELSDGGRFLLFLDNSTQQWFVQGIFD